MSTEPILITGGAGYIGSHTVVELIKDGFRVVIADNLSNSHQSVIDAIQKITGVRPGFVKADLGRQEDVQKLFTDHRFGAVIHFAAFKSVGESVEKPLDYYRNNLFSMVLLLEQMRTGGVKNIVFSSSCSVYGEPDRLPVKETDPVKKAECPYANTKQICEEILYDSSRVLPLNVISLRYFNPVGAHESALIGELPLGKPTNLVPVITQTAIGKRKEMHVFGHDYDTPDGTCIRDYIHVVDVARAHVTALHRQLGNRQRQNYEVFNLGTGKGHTVLEVIRSFERVSGVKLNYTLAPRRPGDVEKVFADTRFANEELGWKTGFDLDTMLSSAWKWEQSLVKR
jgi:UDP-glucose 4-epimerase